MYVNHWACQIRFGKAVGICCASSTRKRATIKIFRTRINAEGRGFSVISASYFYQALRLSLGICPTIGYNQANDDDSPRCHLLANFPDAAPTGDNSKQKARYMLIIDSHLDLAWNAMQHNRDLTQSVYTIRTREGHTSSVGGGGQGTVALPEMRKGRVFLAVVTLMARHTGQLVPYLDYGSQAQATAAAQGHLAYYRALEAHGHVRIVTDRRILDQHVTEWQAWEAAGADAAQTPPLGFIISMESADPIWQPSHLAEWHAAGLRLIGPTHYGPGRYAGGTATEIGLSALGKELLGEMRRVGVILDMTHFSDQAFWQALEIYDGPIIASHQNCRALVPHQRQFDDEQLKAIIARDGVISAAFDNWMIRSGWTLRTRHETPVTIAHVVDHIDYVCQLAGNTRHAAIGSDLDGGFGREQSPVDLDTIADMQKVGEILATRGYSEADIAGIMHGNWLRVLRKQWSA